MDMAGVYLIEIIWGAYKFYIVHRLIWNIATVRLIPWVLIGENVSKGCQDGGCVINISFFEDIEVVALKWRCVYDEVDTGILLECDGNRNKSQFPSRQP